MPSSARAKNPFARTLFGSGYDSTKHAQKAIGNVLTRFSSLGSIFVDFAYFSWRPVGE